MGRYLIDPDFWERTLQNWQSEFLAVGTMAVFTIYLRQRGSPESKPSGRCDETASQGSRPGRVRTSPGTRARTTRRTTDDDVTEQLVKHIDEAYAMEQNVLRMLDRMIETSEDPR